MTAVECRDCGHLNHPRWTDSLSATGCPIVWMGERCGCGADPAVHPYRPSAIRNDRCLDCGQYEEDGPHTAATD